MKFKMRSLEGALLQKTGVLTRRLGHRHIPRDDHVRAQGEGSHLQAKERGPRRNQPCGHLDLRLSVSRTVRKLNLF